MNRTSFAAIFLFLSVPATVVADGKPQNGLVVLPPCESVEWIPQRNVKDAILQEIDQFGKNFKNKLGPKTLAFKPFIAVNDSPEAAEVASQTVEQIVDRMLKVLRQCADHDNKDFLPKFQAYRRAPIASGSDLVTKPLFGKHPSVAAWAGNWTFKVEWELVDGRFKNDWDNNDIDEVYEVELNATLSLGIAISSRNEQKLMVIDHLVTKPIVIGWRVSLVASEGKVQEVLPNGK